MHYVLGQIQWKLLPWQPVLKFFWFFGFRVVDLVLTWTPKDIYASVKFGHDPVKTVAIATISVLVLRFLDFDAFDKF